MTTTSNPGDRKDSAAAQSLLAPSSAHPVLDGGTQSFLDARHERGGVPLYLKSADAARSIFVEMQAGLGGDAETEAEDLLLPVGPNGSVQVRIVRPTAQSEPLPVVLYFHGGGWMAGDRHTHYRLIRDMSEAINAVVVFVDYARSPEHKFPNQNEEAYAAMAYVATHAAIFNVDARRLALAGDCAGGNMVAAVAILAKQRGGPSIALQVMFYPVMSAAYTSASYREFSVGPWVSAESMKNVIDAQFPPLSQTDMHALPLNANYTELEGLPPALIITAENDVVRDEGEQYAKKLMQAGVEVTATRYLGTIHDFITLNDLADTPPSRAALNQACSVLRSEFSRMI